MSETASPAPASESDIKLWNMIAHLSALVGCCIPFGNIIAPLIVWQIKKAEMPSVEVHAKEAMNFQITAMIILIPAYFVGIIVGLIVGILGLLVCALVGLAGLAVLGFTVYAGIQANNGVDFKYPFSFKLVK